MLDILIAARKAQVVIQGFTWEQFQDSELHQLAIVRLLEIIGEAARNVSQETRDAHPEIPWNQIVGLRNRLVHAYTDIHLPTIWDILQTDIPQLITAVEPLVPPE